MSATVLRVSLKSSQWRMVGLQSWYSIAPLRRLRPLEGPAWSNNRPVPGFSGESRWPGWRNIDAEQHDRDFCGNWTAWPMSTWRFCWPNRQSDPQPVDVGGTAACSGGWEKNEADPCRVYHTWTSITEDRGRRLDGFVHMLFYVWLNIYVLKYRSVMTLIHLWNQVFL